jgi:carbamoyl-phosphate synthase large subunit
MTTIAVTGMNAKPDNPGPGIAVARCLRAALARDVRIIGFGYDILDPGLYVREYVDAGYLLPYPSAGEEALYARLAAVHADDPIDAFIPCLDAELGGVIRLQPRLKELGIRTFLPTAEQLQLRAKDRLPELAKRAGIQCPEMRVLHVPGFHAVGGDSGWGYPLVVKGLFYDAEICANAEQATAAFRSIAAEWGLPVIVQRYISGEEYNVAALGDGKGAMLGAVTMKKRAVTSKGKAWAGVCTFDQRLHDAAAALVKALRWRGPLEIEVMRDANGGYHLIEINPRFPAWTYLTHGAGCNLPAVLVDLIFGRRPPAIPEARVGTMFVRYAEESIVPLVEYESIVITGQTVANRYHGQT